MSRYRFTLIAFAVFCALWALSGVHAATPANWLAESKVFFLTLPIMVAVIAYVRMSKTSVTLIFVFLVLHLIGMHFNYGYVPFGNTLGHWMHTDRNMYDRLVHFSFGFLLFYPIREVLLRFGQATGFFGYFLPLNVVLSFSAIFEIMEWRTVSGLSASVGYLFIGGNDPFDSVKDMASAGMGAFTALLIFVVINFLRVTGFWKGIKKSLRLRKTQLKEEDALL